MDFEWDDDKAEHNLRKHGVRFAEAVTVFYDPLAVTFEDEGFHSEARAITIGHSERSQVLWVVHTDRVGQTIRIISARKATKREKHIYEEGI